MVCNHLSVPTANARVAKTPLRFVNGWVITSHTITWSVITYPCHNAAWTMLLKEAPGDKLRSTGTLWVAVTWLGHYNDVIMGAMASQITSLTIVYSTVYSCGDQRKHQSSASLAFVRGIQRRWFYRLLYTVLMIDGILQYLYLYVELIPV